MKGTFIMMLWHPPKTLDRIGKCHNHLAFGGHHTHARFNKLKNSFTLLVLLLIMDNVKKCSKLK